MLGGFHSSLGAQQILIVPQTINTDSSWFMRVPQKQRRRTLYYLVRTTEGDD